MIYYMEKDFERAAGHFASALAINSGDVTIGNLTWKWTV
jgi:hypothetical protein